MLELDLYLVPFAEREYLGLSAVERRSYRELLEEADWEILDWLQGRSPPPLAFEGIIGRIRTAGAAAGPTGAAAGPRAVANTSPTSGHEIEWTLGVDWFVAVGGLHVLVGIVLGVWWSPWWGLASGLSLAAKCLRARPDESYRLLAFEDALEVRRGEEVLRRVGPCWLTERWLVIPTARRVLPVRRGRLAPQDFARLRRAALAGG